MAVGRAARGGGHGLRGAARRAAKAKADALFPIARAPGLLQGAGLDDIVESLPTTGTQKIQKGEIFPKNIDPRTLPDAFDLRSLKKRGSPP